MDFFQIGTREIERGPKKGEFEIFPDFTVGRSKDLMVRGRSFYAIWDEQAGLWSTDEYDVRRLVDEALLEHAQKVKADTGTMPHIKFLRSFGTGGWSQFRKFLQNISDNSHDLDTHLTFANTEVKKTDYASKRLPYPLTPGECPAWDELIGTLYSVEERAKIEWTIGAIVSGDSKRIQKFLVLYGPAGTGKSTVLNIVQKLFEGYTTTFEAKALGGNNNNFATEAFKGNPLVAIQHDGDLSKIEDNTKLNSVIAHEDMAMNEKYKPTYTGRVNAFLLMGTNQPVKISDAKSGIIRRLIDVHPTGVKIPANHYNTLMAQIDFELGAIAYHCLEVYRKMGKNYYNAYRPLEMMLQTDIFFNFIEAYYDVFRAQDGTTLKQAYGLYKEFCSDTGIERPLPAYKVREELRNYFDEFKDRAQVDGVSMRSYYSGFNANKFKTPMKGETTFSLVMEETTSIFDEEFALQPAQLEVWDEDKGIFRPARKWENVRTTLSDIDTSQIHYVKVPEHHIVIDFDLKDPTGNKSLEMNLEAASNWPPTYAELSKGGAGVHLHYNYDGDVTELAANYSEGIEVKTLLGDAALRRRLSKCNNVPVAILNTGLPIKEKKVLSAQTIQSEMGLRELIARNLRKEIHPGTKPSIDFIKKILDDAYESGMSYDLTDMRSKILAFANNSTHQALYCLKVVQQMQFRGMETDSVHQEERPTSGPEKASTRLAFFDVEVYPNLFVICWKYEGDAPIVKMVNPDPKDVEALFRLKLVGFNNRRYDNHILYARFMGYDNESLYKLSQRLISGDRNAYFGEAYNISYADIFEFSSKKQSLKKFGIDLGMHHMEMDIPWDQPVPADKFDAVVEYCGNDVELTEATFEDRRADFVARQILADLSGLQVNDTTQRHTARIIFGNDRRPQEHFNYVDLAEQFPGYVYDHGKSVYQGEDPSEGGYVYAEHGMYDDVVVLDVASMHPTSIVQLNLFGKYTPRFKDLLDARLAIKHEDYAAARKMLNGQLAPYLQDEKDAEKLSYALKIVINIVYGMTSAKFENPFKDVRNKDNIVAKRGALFMIDLKNACKARGMQVVHIKTDSIKLVAPSEEDVKFVMDFGDQYGYTFEHESTYKKFCLTTDADYIAYIGWAAKPWKIGTWEATGAKFSHPYVFKKLFSHEGIRFDDVCETKQVAKGVMYLDFDAVQKPMFEYEGMHHVGRTGRFVPVPPEAGGGILYRVNEGKRYAVTGTKGYFWLEADHIKAMGEEFSIDKEVDLSYFDALVTDAIKTINKYGDFDEFVNV